MAKAEIFKLQRPLMQFGGPPLKEGHVDVLAYNRDRSTGGQFPMAQAEVDSIFGAAFKVYALGKWDRKTKSLSIIALVEDQPW